MITTPSSSPTPLLSVAGFRKFTPEQYHKLADVGIIVEGEPIELLEGYLVEKPMKGPAHETSMRRLTARFAGTTWAGFFTQIQGALALGESEPEPDASVLRGDETTCDGRLPGPADVALVVEVSATSLPLDRRDKTRIYARHAIPVYWIVNVVDRQIEVYTDPQPAATPPTYATRTDYAAGQSVPVVLDGQAVAHIPVADLLP